MSSIVVRQRRPFSDIAAERIGTIDITGYHINISDPATVTLYNESMTNFLTHENDPSTSLRAIRENDKNIGMVNALLAFQMIRQPKPSNPNERLEIAEILRDLERSLNAGNNLLSFGEGLLIDEAQHTFY